MRTILFYRDFARFTGGHLKVWHYFKHVQSSDRYRPEIVFSADSIWDESNPWYIPGRMPRTGFEGLKPDALFVGGLDWQAVEPLFEANPHIPVINLVQSLFHAKPDHPRFKYLGRRALRICVSEQVQDAIITTGIVNGPVYVIPNGMDRSELPSPLGEDDKDTDLLIAAVKHPGMGARLSRALQQSGLRIRLLSERLPRADFYAAIRRARTTLFLPQPEEGFYFPALEGMALETLVICPDCHGNRAYCMPKVNCLRPEYNYEAILSAVNDAIRLDKADRAALRAGAAVTVNAHDLMAERRTFLRLLAEMEPAY